MVKWLDKKRRARLQFEYHKGTIEARKAIIQEMFDWGVTYENFCEDWMEEIARTVADETEAVRKNARTKPMRRVLPSEDYFWDVICRSIYTDQSYYGGIGHDGEGNVVSVDDPHGFSPSSHYEYPLYWMSGHCRFLLEPNPDPQDHATTFYGKPEGIPHSWKTRIDQSYRLLRKLGKELFAPLGIAYILNLIRELLLRSTP